MREEEVSNKIFNQFNLLRDRLAMRENDDEAIWHVNAKPVSSKTAATAPQLIKLIEKESLILREEKEKEKEKNKKIIAIEEPKS